MIQSTGEQFDGDVLLPIWEGLRHWDKRLEAAEAAYSPSVDFTERRLDESQPSGTYLYINASRLISYARESQAVLERTMTGDHGFVTLHATLNLIRPAFEAALTALWLLEAPARRERLTRSMRFRWQDHQQLENVEKAVLNTPGITDKLRQELMDRASRTKREFDHDRDALGLTEGQTHARINLVQAIEKLDVLRGDKMTRVTIEFAWRVLSGVQHGLEYATMLMGKEIKRLPIPGGKSLLMTVNDDKLTMMIQCSAMVQAWAMSTYIIRTKNPEPSR